MTTLRRRLYNSKEAAWILHIDPKTLRKEVNGGNLPFILVGKRQMFDPADIEQFIKERRTLCQSENEATPLTSGTIFASKVVGIAEARRRLPAKRPA